MKIEVGKFYKTRDGRKVTIYAIQHNCDFEYPICGHMEGDAEFSTWTINGSNGSLGYTLYPEDIVSEWEEPRPRVLAYMVINPARLDYGTLILTDYRELRLTDFRRCPWLDEPENKE